MLEDFNLIIATSRGNERNVCSEMWYLIGELGDRSSIIETTPIIGLVLGKSNLKPTDVVHGLRPLLKERPWEFKYTLKVTPITMVVPADESKIKEAALTLGKGIDKNESFRLTVEKRHTKLSSRSIIESVAKDIERKVDLENPNKILLIEIVAEFAGLALIKSDEVLSVEKEKRLLATGPASAS